MDLGANDYDLAARVALAQQDGLDLALVSLSSPFGIESLPADQAGPLLDAYHDGVDQLPEPFGAWAGLCVAEPNAQALERELARGRVGLQVPATAVGTPAGWERLAGLLVTLESHDRPLLVHPGPAVPDDERLPSWWLPVVSFVGQLHAAWFAWLAGGRARHPGLRVCFVGLAGLAPLQLERLAARGGDRVEADPDVFFEISSYGGEAIGAIRGSVGIGCLVNGSDRPYAAPAEIMDAPTARAIRVQNTRRLLFGGADDEPEE